jgi:3-oxoadipate enol-lactonase
MKFQASNKLNIFYDVKNQEGTNGTVVFLNGVMASVSSWKFQIDAFKNEDYKIILHDFAGQLLSDKFEDKYSFKQHANDLNELLTFLNEDYVHLIGTSYGGEVAMMFASMFPKKVLSLSVIDSVSELDQNLIDSVEDWIKLASSYNGEQFFYGMMPTIYGENYIKNNKEFLDQRAKAMNDIPKSYFDGQIGLYKTFLHDVYMTDILMKIKCPSLIICGENDTLKPLKFSEVIKKNIKDSKLIVIPDCGHVTIFEQPEKLNEHLLHFISFNS